MDITYIPATDLKRKAAEILNTVYYEKKIAVVERFGKALVKIIPYEEEKISKKNKRNLLDKYFGALPDFPEAKNNRFFRKKNLVL